MDISFVGVWDTVASVGLFPTFLPFTKSNTAIKTFRHALSLDEHRAKFKPSCYERITRGEAARGDWRAPVRRLGKVAGAGAGAKGKKGSANAKEREEVAARGRSLTKKGSAVRDEAVEETLKKTLTKTTTMTTTTVTTTEEVQSQSQSQSSPPKSASLPPGPSSSSSSPPPRPTKAPTFGAPSSSPTPASTSKPRAESSGSGSGSGSASRTRRLLGSLRRSARGAHDTVHGLVDTVHGLVDPALKELGDMAMADRARSRSKSHSREKEDEKEQLSPDSERDKLEQMYLDRSRKTDVKEVWFAGVHCGESYYFHSYFSRVYAFAFSSLNGSFVIYFLYDFFK